MNAQLRAFLETIDIAVVGLANCGSCTGWTVHDALAALNAGLPTTAVATANFDGFAKILAKRGGRSGLRVHVLPYPLNERMRQEIDAIGRDHFARMLVTMGAKSSGQLAA